jgi:hypothetical protein
MPSCRYWHYLGWVLGQAVAQVPDSSYKQHVINAFHQRAKEMDVPLLKLALFLDPRYRQAATRSAGAGTDGLSSSTSPQMAALLKEAGQLAQRLGYSQEEVRQLMVQMRCYAANKAPFNQQDLMPSTYWNSVVAGEAGVQVQAPPPPADAAAQDAEAAAAAAGRPAGAGQAVSGPQLLANIPTRLLDVKPSAMAPEQVGAAHSGGELLGLGSVGA